MQDWVSYNFLIQQFDKRFFGHKIKNREKKFEYEQKNSFST